MVLLDVSMPDPEELARKPERAYHAPRFRYPGEGGRPGPMVRYSERFDYDRLRQVMFVAMEFAPEDGGPAEIVDDPRQLYADEAGAAARLLEVVRSPALQAELHAAARPRALRFSPPRGPLPGTPGRCAAIRG